MLRCFFLVAVITAKKQVLADSGEERFSKKGMEVYECFYYQQTVFL